MIFLPRFSLFLDFFFFNNFNNSELEESLLVLPFAVSTDLLSILETFLSNGWETELTSRCLLFLLR